MKMKVFSLNVYPVGHLNIAREKAEYTQGLYMLLHEVIHLIFKVQCVIIRVVQIKGVV